VTLAVQRISDRVREHLVDQPFHDERRRSRRPMSVRTRSASRSSASIR
jgi:hypothetical protein